MNYLKNVMLSVAKHFYRESKPNQKELLLQARCFDKLSMTV